MAHTYLDEEETAGHGILQNIFLAPAKITLSTRNKLLAREFIENA